jgi:hypothetical protein
MDKDSNDIAKLAIHILSIIANTAATERNFSQFGLTHTKIRNKLNVERVHNANVVKNDLRRKHANAGLTHVRKKRNLGCGNSVGTGADTSESRSPADEDVDFRDIGERLIRDARTALDDPDDTSVPVIIIPPLSGNSRSRNARATRTNITLKSLFRYAGEGEPCSGSDVGLDFYWKGGLKNLEKEIHAYELVYDAEAGIPSNSVAEPMGASVIASSSTPM